MARSRRTEISVGILLLASVVICAGLALQLGSFAGFSKRTHVTVAFTDAAGLSPGAAVAVAGVDVGSVESLTLDFDRAVVHLALDPAAQLRQGTIAQVRARSVLGEKYVELLPTDREAPLLADGDQLIAGRQQTEIDEMVNDVGPLLSAVDPETMRQLIDGVVSALEEDPDRLARMLDNVDVLLANAARASEELPTLMGDARRTLASTERAAASVQARAAEAAPLISRADDVLVDLQAASEPLPALVDDATLTLDEVRQITARLDGSMGELERILENFGEIDKWELRRLLREEGILIRLKPSEVVVDEGG